MFNHSGCNISCKEVHGNIIGKSMKLGRWDQTEVACFTPALLSHDFPTAFTKKRPVWEE